MKKKQYSILTILLLFCLAFSNEEINLRFDHVQTNMFPDISMTFSAWTANGVPLTELTPEDITLQENEGPAFHPDTLTLNEDAPLAVALVMDVSGSMQGQPLADAKVAAARFLDRLTEQDQAALIAFSNEVDTDPNNLHEGREIAFTQNLTLVYDTIENLNAEGGTELYFAVEKAVKMTETLPVGHRAVLVLSDGVNEPADLGDPDSPITLAQESGIPIYVIGLGNAIDEPYLRRLSSETGGYFRLTPKSSELAQTFDDMAALLKTQYEMVYTSSLTGGEQEAEVNITIQYEGASTSQSVMVGPLPEIEVPDPTITISEATEISETEEVIPTATATNTPIVEAQAEEEEIEERGVLNFMEEISPWGWVILAGVIIGLGILIIMIIKNKKNPPEKCANCGFDITGRDGPCPQCGSTRRLQK